MSDEKHIQLSQWDGSADGWRASLPLKPSWTQPKIVVDATPLTFVVPTFLLRLRTFIDFNLSRGKEVQVLAPRNPQVANYMSRMQVAAGLSENVFIDLPEVSETDQSDVLVPITCLKTAIDVDQMGDRLYALFQGHYEDDIAGSADALQEGFSELCGNAVEHGSNKLGCFVAAQRYRGSAPRTVLSIGDIGVGVPKHMRRVYKDQSDRRLLRRAIESGITGTGETHRGNGIPSVLEEAENAQIRYAELEIRSGDAHLKHRIGAGRPDKTTTEPAAHKRGTWICFTLGPLN